jgi:translation initiation factor 2B subunit (eIF-2B alpha/beta/delta family)
MIQTEMIDKKDSRHPLVVSVGELVKKYEEEGNWADLKKEIFTAKAILEGLSANVVDERTLVAILKTIETIASAVEKQLKIEEKTSISLEQFAILVQRIIQIIEENVSNFEEKRKIFDEMEKLLKL